MNTATLTIASAYLLFCSWPASAMAGSDNRHAPSNPPVDPLAPIVITVMAIVLLLSVMIYFVYTRRAARPRPVKSFKFAEIIADIPFAIELTQVGPLRPEDTHNAFSNSVRSLSLACDQALQGSQGKSLALIGTQADSGTSTIAIALARSLAHSGKHTLLLDLNFERPMVQLTTGSTNTSGFSNFLSSGLIDGIAVQDTQSPMDVIGTGNLPTQQVKDYLARGRYKGSLNTLMSLYERIVVDCAPCTEEQPDISRILAKCDLRLLVIDALQDSVPSPAVQGQLRIHRHWQQGNTLLLRNKVKTESDTHLAAGATLRPQASLHSVHAEEWILQQADDMFTLKLCELRYRPVLTRRQISNYAGHQVACFRLTILGNINYLLILGTFPDREAAVQAARSMGLDQSSVLPVTFENIKKGIRLERYRKKQKNYSKV